MTTEQVEDWKTWARRQGVMAVFLAGFAIWFGSAIVIPLRDDQRRFMDSVIETNKKHADVAAQLTTVQQTQATQLASISELLKQIRDDQRRGVWNDSPARQP